MPGLIGERITSVLDRDKDGFLKIEEFQKGFLRLFNARFEDSIRLVFDLFDFTGDGKVSKEDFRILLSHVPLVKILELIKVHGRSEGTYTQRDDGLYFIIFFIYFFIPRAGMTLAIGVCSWIGFRARKKL